MTNPKMQNSKYGTYLLDNSAPQTAARFDALADLYDEGTFRHLQRIGVQEGWQCWEIGTGQGSVANWLVERVGRRGHVLASDIDPRFLLHCERPNLTVRRHNIVTDELPQQKFDLIHLRLVLMHLPERQAVVDRIVTCLNPGGWLLAEEFDSLSLLPAPDHYPGEMALKAAEAVRKLMTQQGVQLDFGRTLVQCLRTHGMIVEWAEGLTCMHLAKSAGARLMRANLEQLREAILENSLLTSHEFEEDLRSLDREDLLVPAPVLWSVAGRHA